MFNSASEVFNLYNKIISGEIIEKDKEYHIEIAQALKDDYALAFECFAECSIEFYEWFSNDFLYEIIQIIEFHKQKELLVLLKNHLVELAGGNAFDKRISSVHSIYHVTYKICR